MNEQTTQLTDSYDKLDILFEENLSPFEALHDILFIIICEMQHIYS